MTEKIKEEIKDVQENSINYKIESIRKLLNEALKYKRLFGLSGVRSRKQTELAVSMLDTLRDKNDIQLSELQSVDNLLDNALKNTTTKHYAVHGREKFNEAHKQLRELIDALDELKE